VVVSAAATTAAAAAIGAVVVEVSGGQCHKLNLKRALFFRVGKKF
jgi:mono/diheme cytochrome c family protein